jgi:hypothetical protein
MSDEAPSVQPRWFYATDAPRPHSGKPSTVPNTRATGASTHKVTPETDRLDVTGQTAGAYNMSDKEMSATPPSSSSTEKLPVPTNWEPFSDEDTRELEAAYQRAIAARPDAPEAIRSPLVPVQEDGLFEVDVRARLLRPIYWRGNAYEVRRALWFQPSGSKYEPCDENLARQIEDGFQ